MWSKVLLIVLGIFLAPLFLFSQEKIKYKKENYLHFKVGGVVNFENKALIRSLNGSDRHVFVSNRSIFYNPSVDIEFEHRFSKHVGLNIDFGFLQTRQSYHYIDLAYNQKQDGLIISNIGHFNLHPSFYIKNTTIFGGVGVYKYFYWFSPVQVGELFFDQNAEGFAIYSNIGITQKFDVKTHTFTISANYFGLAKIYDSGFQLSVGMAL